jgi:regulator of replication initiation timing
VDGDGDQDAFVANYNQANKVWVNDGAGIFSDSGQNLSSLDSLAVALGDVDGDGDQDAFVANIYSQGNKVWVNDGDGTFSDFGQSLGSSDSFAAALGDVDGDGDLDAFVANIYSQANKVWLHDFYCFADIDEDGDVDEQDLTVLASEYGHSNCEIELITKVMNENVALKKEISRLKARLASKMIDKQKLKGSSGRHFQKINIAESIFYCFADIDEDGDVDGQDLAVTASEYGHSYCEIELVTKVMNENVALKKEISRLKAQLASIMIEEHICLNYLKPAKSM